MILFQHGKPIKKAITQVERLIREEKILNLSVLLVLTNINFLLKEM